MQIRVRQRFHELRDQDAASAAAIEKDGGGTTHCQDGTVHWYTVSAAQSMDNVEADIYKAVQETVGRVQQGKPLQKMWEAGTYDL